MRVVVLVGASERERTAAGKLALATAFEPLYLGEFVRFEGTRAYFKKNRFHGKTRLRYMLKWLCLQPVPRVREYKNLVWLRERLFQAPRPLAAGLLCERGVPRLQFLLTEAVAGAVTLEDFLRDGPEHERSEVLEEVAREVARMHALRFIHHDLYPRNLLVGDRGELSRVTFLDAWAGGPGLNLRGPAYDLACFLLRAHETMSAEERERFVERYVEERAAQGRPVAPPGLLEKIRRERRALIERLARRPYELRGDPLPALDP